MEDNHFVAIRVAEYFPAQPLALEDVQAEITISLVNTRAAAAAEKKAQTLLAQLAVATNPAPVVARPASEVGIVTVHNEMQRQLAQKVLVQE